MGPTILQNPLVEDCLATLRDRKSSMVAFRAASRRISFILATETGKFLETTEVTIETPLENTSCKKFSNSLVLVPILRAGLGMVDAFLEIFPEAELGHIGLERNETTAQPDSYYSKLPELAGKRVLLLDPMLATGGSLSHAVELLMSRGANQLTAISIIAAPEGVEKICTEHPDLQLVLGCVDRCLDENSFIRPGLGDYGDRLMGTI